MSEVRFVTAWRRNDAALQADAKAYWERCNLVRPDQRDQRAAELCALAYAGGEVVSVSTAELIVLPGLRQRFAMCRASVDPKASRATLGAQMTGYMRTVLEGWSAEHAEEKVMGISAVLVSTELVDKQRDPLWPEWGVDLTLVGYMPSGEQIRVGWFKHARL